MTRDRVCDNRRLASRLVQLHSPTVSCCRRPRWIYACWTFLPGTFLRLFPQGCGVLILCGSPYSNSDSRPKIRPRVPNPTPTLTDLLPMCLYSQQCAENREENKRRHTVLKFPVVVVVHLFQQVNKTCNNNIINFTKRGNQKGKCPSCWPPVAQTE